MQGDGYWNHDEVKFLGYSYSNGVLLNEAEMTSGKSACPECGVESAKVHSRYARNIADLPCFGAFCSLSLRCRRFFCNQSSCIRKVVCERLGPMAEAYARKSSRRLTSLYHLSFQLAAKAAAQLCKSLGIKTSASALNRYVRSFDHEAFESPRVLGTDDWALRKGQSYGTLLVDLANQQPIDLLEGRDAQPLATWLKHPKVEIISRDRSGEYALAIGQAAPQAIDVADRWHLLKNLREMVERYFQVNSAAIGLAYERTLEHKRSIHIPTPSLSSRSELEKRQKRQRRLERFNKVHQ